jgi:hypothetical protein
VIDGSWRSLDLTGTPWGIAIQFMLRREDEDVVLVAPKRDKRFPELLDGLERLRKARIAEPD